MSFIITKSFKYDAKIQMQTAGFAIWNISRKHKQAYGCNILQSNELWKASTKASKT